MSCAAAARCGRARAWSLADARRIGARPTAREKRSKKAERDFETNTFGVMAMTQAVIPQLRARKSGVVINVTSSVTFAPMPLVSVYTASKTAIEGFTGSLAHELQALQRSRQAGRARLRPDDTVHAKLGDSYRGRHPGAVHGVCDTRARGIRETGRGDDREGRCRDRLARCKRCLRAASLPGRAGRSGAGRAQVTTGQVSPF